MEGIKVGKLFDWDKNPLRDVRVKVPTEPLLMEKLNQIKKDIGIAPTQNDSVRIEGMKERQKREQSNNF